MKNSIAELTSTTGNVAGRYPCSGKTFRVQHSEWSNFAGGRVSWPSYSVLVFPPLVMKLWLPQLPQTRSEIPVSENIEKNLDHTAIDR